MSRVIRTTKAFYSFMLWDNVLINGQARQAGVQNLLVPLATIDKRYPSEGGFLARAIYATVVADEKKNNPNAKVDEAWGWLPPPLAGEGRKVQSGWLHDFLLDPYPDSAGRRAADAEVQHVRRRTPARWPTTSRRSTTPTIRTNSTSGPRATTWPSKDDEPIRIAWTMR